MALQLRTKQGAARLLQIHPQIRRSLASLEASLILVPELSSKSSKSDLEQIWAQLSSGLPESNNLFVAAFDYTWDSEAENIWHSLGKLGVTLLDQIVSQTDSFELNKRPLIFVALGLGGIILKQALLTSKDRNNKAHRLLSSINGGIVFVGTPHPKRGKVWTQVKIHLQATLKAKLSKLFLAKAESNVTLVEAISDRFNQADSGIGVPKLSFYELKETKVSTGLLLNSQRRIIVDEELAKTLTVGDALKGVEADHNELISFQHEVMFGPIQIFIKNAIERFSGGGASAQASDNSINDELDEGAWTEVDANSGSNSYLPVLAQDAVGQQSSHAKIEQLPTLADFVLQQSSLPIPCYLLSPAVRNSDFFGREDVLQDIDRCLLPNARPASSNAAQLQTYAICGLGGVGKTQVAIEYVFSRKTKFDAIFWIESDEPTQLAEGFSRIAAQLGFSDAADVDRVNSRNIALDWLASPLIRTRRDSKTNQNVTQDDIPKASWLLVFNNADDLHILQRYMPSGCYGSVLITTRDPVGNRSGSGKDLNSFLPDDAASLLLKRLPSVGKNAENKRLAIDLVSRLGGLPLAIVQVAAFIERYSMTLPEFMRFYDKETSISKVAQVKSASFDDHYQHSLFTVWALERFEPQTLLMLRTMSFLNPDRIQESLFTEDFTDLAHYGLPVDDDAYLSARADLLKVSLAKRNKDDNELVLHRLVQDVVRVQMTESDAVAAFEVTMRMLRKGWPTTLMRFDHDATTWPKSELILQHIVKIQRVYLKHPKWNISNSGIRDFCQLLLFGGWYLHERSDFHAAKPLFVNVLEICRKNLPDLKDLLGDVLFCLSTIYAVTNDDRAQNLKYAQEHFQFRLDNRDGSEHAERRLATAYGALSYVYLLSGDYHQSIFHSREAIRLTRESPDFKSGEDWPTFASCDQAFSLIQLGEFDEAERVLNDTLGYWTSHSKVDSHLFQLGFVYRGFAYLRKKQGRPEDSHSASQIALAHLKASSGNESRFVSQICSNLGEHHVKIGQYAIARIYFEQAIKGFRMHDCYNSELARTYYRLSQLEECEGDPLSAQNMLLKARELYMSIPGVDRSKTLLTAQDFDEVIPCPHR